MQVKRSIKLSALAPPLLITCAIGFYCAHFMATSVYAANPVSAKTDQESKKTLAKKSNETIKRIDGSSELIRRQILKNAGAPFLADLYLQLGQLQIEKADAQRVLSLNSTSSGSLSGTPQPIGLPSETKRTLMDAISVLATLERDFPKFQRRLKGMFILVTAQSALEDEHFIETVKKMVAENPGAPETQQAQILAGNFHFEKKDYSLARPFYESVIKLEPSPERAAAHYKMALILLEEEKYESSLNEFEKSLRDASQVTATPLDLKSSPILLEKKLQTLRREVLLDSVRAFTRIEKNPRDPIVYYSTFSSNEVVFQEVLEKLARRYLLLKKTPEAAKLLRVLSERNRQPEKVVRIFADLFNLADKRDLETLTSVEVGLCLQQLNIWKSYFQVDPAELKRLTSTLEQGFRALATQAHDRSKATSEPRQKLLLLNQAIGIYEKYIDELKDSEFRSALATNLASAYSERGLWKECAEQSYDTARGFFGTVPDSNVEKLINDGLFCSEKIELKEKTTFFESYHHRGVRIGLLNTLIKVRPRFGQDPQIQFALTKTKYEQGLTSEAAGAFKEFVNKYPKSKYAASAGELLLDYYNTRFDLKELKETVSFLKSKGIADPAFIEKLNQLERQLALRKLSESAELLSKKTKTSEAQSYLELASSNQDSAIKNVALQKALESSRLDGSVEVFFQSVGALAKSETNPEQKQQLYESSIQMALKLGQIVRAISLTQELAQVSTPKTTASISEVQKKVRDLWILLRNPYPVLNQIAKSESLVNLIISILQDGNTLPQSLLQTVNQSLNSSTESNPSETSLIFFQVLNDNLFQYSDSDRTLIRSWIKSQCLNADRAFLCDKDRFSLAEDSTLKIIQSLRLSGSGIDSLESKIQEFQRGIQELSQFSSSTSRELNVCRLVGVKSLFEEFFGYLSKVESGNPELKAALTEKKQEAKKSSQDSLLACQQIPGAKASCQLAFGSGCLSRVLEMTRSEKSGARVGSVWPNVERDPSSPSVAAAQKAVFLGGGGWLNIGLAYYKAGNFHHALAVSQLGIQQDAINEDSLKRLAGCAALNAGLPSEARSFFPDVSPSQCQKLSLQLAMTGGG